MTVPALPLNVGWLTVPVGVPVTDTEPSVPVKEGVLAEALAPTITVALPCVGRVPAPNVMASVLPVTDMVKEGKLPVAVIVAMFAVDGVTVMVGALTFPEGVKLPVEVIDDPEKEGWLTVPAGVNEPLASSL